MDYVVSSILAGATAAAATDLWALARRPLFGVAPPDWGLVGRWFAYMPRGRFVHQRIAAAAPVRGERALGWAAHYLTGIAFAAALIGVWGLDWVRRPTLGPALAVGLASVAAPFLLMQPGMGAGLFARFTAKPAAARVQSVLTHAVLGLGLYAGGFVAGARI